MNSVAFLLGRWSVTWPGMFAALGAGCAMLLALGLWVGRGHRPAALLWLFAAALPLGLVLGRLAHWYCHPMQYDSLAEALTDYLRGDFSLWGVFIGVLLAAVLFAASGLSAPPWELLDLLAPAAALGVAVGRLGALLDLSDRGKFALASPELHRLPFSAFTVLTGEEGQWRFATFAFQSLYCLVLALALLALLLWAGKRLESGTLALFFALFYGAGQILLDSTRYDGDFFRFNGFIHVPQLLSALAAAAAMGVLAGRSIRRHGFRRIHAGLLLLALLCFAGSGGMEYYSQRYTGSYALCYGVMGLLLGLLCAAGVALWAWKPGKKADFPERIEQSERREDLTTSS